MYNAFERGRHSTRITHVEIGGTRIKPFFIAHFLAMNHTTLLATSFSLVLIPCTVANFQTAFLMFRTIPFLCLFASTCTFSLPMNLLRRGLLGFRQVTPGRPSSDLDLCSLELDSVLPESDKPQCKDVFRSIGAASTEDPAFLPASMPKVWDDLI